MASTAMISLGSARLLRLSLIYLRHRESAGASIKKTHPIAALKATISTRRLVRMTTFGNISTYFSLLLKAEPALTNSPLVSYDSVTSNLDRLAKIKNFTMFYTDLNDNKLPQWMFITPNMSEFCSNSPLLMLTISADDGHDSSVTTAGKWARSFLTPLLSNTNFMQNTLVLLSKFSA